ncbi:hypothetical protein [Falsiroseomonas oryzae]|uniref:hypothetical protein n=1 Tax=Falsiroseomonas oryzae TaxID=2766473 RepID=UPI0022EA3273|nr:hypothetical protein [Roseomonas sp. MO-31]
MREVLVTAIATRSAAIAEAAAEARCLGRGLQPALPASTVDAAVAELLQALGAFQPAPEPVEFEGQWLHPAAPQEVADTLAYAMRFDRTGKARRTGHEYAARLAADQQVQQLTMRGFVVMRRRVSRSSPPGP